MEQTRPSIFRIIQLDYASFLAAIFLVVIWGMGLYEAWSTQVFALEDFYLALIVTVLALAILVWRYAQISSLYTMGIKAEATVNAAGFYRGRGSIKYIYTHAGQKYISKMTVMKSKRTEKFRVGDQIAVLIDPNKPKRSVITSAFI